MGIQLRRGGVGDPHIHTMDGQHYTLLRQGPDLTNGVPQKVEQCGIHVEFMWNLLFEPSDLFWQPMCWILTRHGIIALGLTTQSMSMQVAFE